MSEIKRTAIPRYIDIKGSRDPFDVQGFISDLTVKLQAEKRKKKTGRLGTQITKNDIRHRVRKLHNLELSENDPEIVEIFNVLYYFAYLLAYPPGAEEALFYTFVRESHPEKMARVVSVGNPRERILSIQEIQRINNGLSFSDDNYLRIVERFYVEEYPLEENS